MAAGSGGKGKARGDSCLPSYTEGKWWCLNHSQPIVSCLGEKDARIKSLRAEVERMAIRPCVICGCDCASPRGGISHRGHQENHGHQFVEPAVKPKEARSP